MKKIMGYDMDENKYPIFYELSKLASDPDENLIFTAIRVLKDSDKIKSVYLEYENFMQEFGKTQEVRNNYRKICALNIAYILRYYSDGTISKWKKLIPQASDVNYLAAINQELPGAKEAFEKRINKL